MSPKRIDASLSPSLSNAAINANCSGTLTATGKRERDPQKAKVSSVKCTTICDSMHAIVR